MNKRKRDYLKRRIAFTKFTLFLGISVSIVNYLGLHRLSMTIFPLVLFGGIALWIYFGKGEALDLMMQVDEREKHIASKARELTALIMVWALICGATIEVLQGKTFGPFIFMASLSGAIFLGCVVVFRIRN